MGLEGIIKKSGKWIRKAFDAGIDLVVHPFTIKSLAVGSMIFFGLEGAETFVEGNEFIKENSLVTHLVASAASVYAAFYSHFKSYAVHNLKKLGAVLTKPNKEWDYNEITKAGAHVYDNSLGIASLIGILLWGGIIGGAWVKLQSVIQHYEVNGMEIPNKYLELADKIPIAALGVIPLVYCLNLVISKSVLFWDSNLKKYSMPTLAGDIKYQLGNVKGAREKYEKAHKHGDSEISRIGLAATNLQLGDYDSALELLTESLGREDLSAVDYVIEGQILHSFGKLLYRGRHIDHTQLATLAVWSLRFGSEEPALELFKELLGHYSEDSPEAAYFGTLHARLLGLKGKDDLARDQWQRIIPRLESIFGPGETLGESKNRVWTVSPKDGKGTHVANTYVFKESSCDLKGEFEFTKYIGDLLKGYKSKTGRQVSVVKPLVHLPKISKGLDALVLLMEKEDTLLKGIKDKTAKYDDFSDCVDLLAYIHVHVPEEKTLGRIDIAEKTRRKLIELQNHLGSSRVSKETIEDIVENYDPIALSLESMEYGYNSDGHPENRLIGKDSIVVLDCEESYYVPVTLDLVNLLEYANFLTREEKLNLIGEYMESYNRHKGENVIQDMGGFVLGYINSVVQRGISLSTAWSDPDRKSLWRKREELMGKAISSIKGPSPDLVGCVQENYPEYYERFSTSKGRSYDLVRSGLIIVKEKIRVANQLL